jgi:trehalose 6-phosphate synthase/phosphatase
MTIREGKDVIEFALRPGNKGDAIDRLREHTSATSVFYAGDDVTDEDAFAVLGPEDLGLKIGRGRTAAGHRVRGPEEVAEALALLADYRAGHLEALRRERLSTRPLPIISA